MTVLFGVQIYSERMIILKDIDKTKPLMYLQPLTVKKNGRKDTIINQKKCFISVMNGMMN